MDKGEYFVITYESKRFERHRGGNQVEVEGRVPSEGEIRTRMPVQNVL
jgi:hypothetical protein